jgi:hypothetical protein
MWLEDDTVPAVSSIEKVMRHIQSQSQSSQRCICFPQSCCCTKIVYSRPGIVSLGSFPPSNPGLLTTSFHPPSTGRSMPFTPTFSIMYLTVGVIWSTVRGTRGKVACLSRSSVKKEEKLPVIAVTTIAGYQRCSETRGRKGLQGEMEAHLIPDGPKKSANAVESADVSCRSIKTYIE